MHFSYDISKTYQENYDAGPSLLPISRPVPEVPGKALLGCTVGGRLGIAAGLLLNSKWILAYAKRGFDLLTYKTVRSSYRPCYPLPNWVFVEGDGAMDEPVYQREGLPTDPVGTTSAVCFGMPSMSPDIWRRDVAVAKEGLAKDQCLIVSVVATPEPNWGVEEIAQDFARCAAWAKESGADMVEANLSCPNVCTQEGSIYLDPQFSRTVSQAVRSVLGSVPLLLKVGHFPEKALMSSFLLAVDGVAHGVTMVNGITRPVLRRDGRPVFGESYLRAGVLGRAIHTPSVRSITEAARLRRKGEHQLALFAVGGAAVVQDIADFFDVGADAVLMGSSPMYCPDLAIEAKAHCNTW